MKKEMIKAFKLGRYGVSLKGNMVILVLFFVAGTFLGLLKPGKEAFFKYLMSNILILCASMFPSQLLVSTDLAFLVQTSPYKKKVQTGLLAKVTFVCNIVALTWLLFLRIVSGILYQSLETELVSIFVTGILLFLFAVCNAFIYKYFLWTTVVIYVFSLVIGIMGRFVYPDIWRSLFVSIHPLWAVVFAYGCVFLGSLVLYGISKLIYKKELSRFAFGAAMEK